ncbi:hypothetical protein BOX15_Mlig026298g2, partial [Macrostomum lignano]
RDPLGMSFGPAPSNGGGKRAGGGGAGRGKTSGGPAGVAAGRPDLQERLRELQSRRDAWMQQRDKSLDASPPTAVAQDRRREPPRQPAPSSTTSAAPAPGKVGPSGLLDRVRHELDDIEREVRASAGLPKSAPQSAGAAAAVAVTSAKSTTSSFSGGGGLRPVSHFCPSCGRLMLGAPVAPQLAPCGHSVCAGCAPRPEEAQPPLRCPHCGLRVSGVRPDAALRAAIDAFSGAGAASSTETTAPSDAAADAAAGSAAARRWLQQLDVISGRMRQLDSSMESLQAEVAQLTGQLEAEAARDRQLAASEAAARKEISRLQAELSSLAEQRSVSRDNQAFIQSEIDAKKEAIQGAFASQQLVSQELAKLQRLCAA